MKFYRKPLRLSTVFQSYDPPLYFITFCTLHRRPILANTPVHDAFTCYGREAEKHGIGVGNYVIMPDHVHLFIRMAVERSVGVWLKGLKRALGRPLREDRDEKSLWQPGFFDHLVRRDESYAEKWEYVRQNPVRKGLVSLPEEWPYQGEIVAIRGA